MLKPAAAAALTIVAFVSTQAAGPFQVRRATHGQDVQSSPPLATIVASPFDGDLPSMQNGTSYYYGVYDASGQAQQISVIRNTVTGTLRISFDDANLTSAPVNAASSSVAVAPATIQADGLHAATITIVPRDGNGVLLGRGLAVAIDSSLLWPAHLTAPIVDLGNGSYLATAVAPVMGIGTVRTTVEGVQLSPLPTITANAVDPAASLRDLAIQQLQSLIGPGGPLSSLGAGSAEAIDRANDALQTLANGDPSRDDNVLKTDFDAILGLLEGVPDARDTMDDLVGIARLIAQWHVDRASSACGTCNGSGSPSKVCDAVASMADGDAMRAAVSPDWGGIVDAYGRAVERALQAFHHC